MQEYKLFNPLDFEDPTTYAVPGFIILILVEFFFYLKKKTQVNKEFYRDAATSLQLGIGSVVIDLAIKAIAIGYLFWFFQFRIFDFLSPLNNLKGLADLEWHKSHWYVWLVLFVAQDFIFYWYHRFAHEIRILWSAHINHHSSQHMHFSTALRQSWLELFFKDIFYIPLALIGFHPIMIVMMYQLNLIYQFLPHTEMVKRMPKWFEFIFNSPAHHRVHHASNVEYLDKNYAGVLIIWDRMFGTFKEETTKPIYGITKNIETYNLLRVTFHELQNIIADVKNAENWKDKLNYMFQAPGWSKDGNDQRAKTLQKNL